MNDNDTGLWRGINTGFLFLSMVAADAVKYVPQKMPQACLLKSIQILSALMLFRITTSPKYFTKVQQKYNFQ